MLDTENAVVAEPTANDKILCHIDNVRVHSIQAHIAKAHVDTWTVERYKAEFPDEPMLSPFAVMTIRNKELQRAAEKAAAGGASAETVTNIVTGLATDVGIFHEVFGLGNVAAAKNKAGNPISVSIMRGHDQTAYDFLPDVDPDYVFNIELLKKVIIGFQLNMPVYLWGYHGTGKTTMLEQAAARTKRPFMRVQHTINMQESDVLGQWTVKDGSTSFQLGPLPMAMINGWVYCADEYDFAMPSVTAVYQPVLEGKSLLIKDAPPHFRKIAPHPEFRFVATGNTNGVGDETGLYQGTLIQNAANYSRFTITEQVEYMNEAIESAIIMAKTTVKKEFAVKLVKFAASIREQFANKKISMPISPRELIGAAKLSIAYGANWKMGLELAYANRLSRVDRRVVQELIQRMFPNE